MNPEESTVSDSLIPCEEVAAMIDHSVLRPELTEEDVRRECETAVRYAVRSVCCAPSDVAAAKRHCAGSGVKVGAVVGFPHGYSRTEVKVYEARLALDDGAEEIDMVLHIGKLRSGKEDYVREDIRAVAEAVHERGGLLKVILENCYLSTGLIALGCRLAEEAGADFVKTSTGFADAGATMEDLRLMRSSVSEAVEVKAAGGVRSLQALLEVRAVGVSRVGATRTASILDECRRRRNT